MLNINKEAIREIDEYLREKITKHLKEKMSRKTLVFKERDSLESLFDKGKIDFRFLNDYFNPDFDFSTYIKFFNIYNTHEINEIINLKRSDLKEYRELINTVILEKDLIGRIIQIINNHHRLVLRKEIFTTIKELYQSKQYQSFVNLAVIQVEGLFYDLCLELNGGVAEQNIGKLVEKVEKSYKYNKYLYHMITPYFLFEFPEIRNKVAHDGIINDINLEDLANELILDIFCIVQQINSPSLPINNVKCLLEKIVAKTGIEINKQDNYETIIYELFVCSGFAINDEYNIYKQIKDRIKYKKVYEFYSIGKTDNFEGIKLDVAVDQLMDVFEDIRFWDIIIKHSNGFNGNEFGFRLLDTLVKEFVGYFQKDHPVKKKCIEAAKFLDQVRNKYIAKSE